MPGTYMIIDRRDFSSVIAFVSLLKNSSLAESRPDSRSSDLGFCWSHAHFQPEAPTILSFTIQLDKSAAI